MSQLDRLKRAVNAAKPEYGQTVVILTFDEWMAITEAAGNLPVAAVFNRPECPFSYCDTKAPHDECKDKCRHTAESQGSSEETAFRKAMSKPPEVWYPCGCKASAGAPKYCHEHHCPVCHKNTIEYVQGTRHFDGTELCVPQAEPPKDNS